MTWYITPKLIYGMTKWTLEYQIHNEHDSSQKYDDKVQYEILW